MIASNDSTSQNSPIIVKTSLATLNLLNESNN